MKIIRLKPAELIRRRVDFEGALLHVILKSGVTYALHLEAIEKDRFIFKNMRQKKVELRLQEIEEVQIDQK
ncbi:MAG: hypothetical protein LAT68_07010 [Cyclobacteriaceae bacterium]|nr:hypothetical protein [Cyclobacteriaceae bacterium]MCH8516063.1 hypothetical protein [Cyclobacteriaceae bacterium]